VSLETITNAWRAFKEAVKSIWNSYVDLYSEYPVYFFDDDNEGRLLFYYYLDDEEEAEA